MLWATRARLGAAWTSEKSPSAGPRGAFNNPKLLIISLKNLQNKRICHVLM